MDWKSENFKKKNKGSTELAGWIYWSESRILELSVSIVGQFWLMRGWNGVGWRWKSQGCNRTCGSCWMAYLHGCSQQVDGRTLVERGWPCFRCSERYLEYSEKEAEVSRNEAWCQHGILSAEGSGWLDMEVCQNWLSPSLQRCLRAGGERHLFSRLSRQWLVIRSLLVISSSCSPLPAWLTSAGPSRVRSLLSRIFLECCGLCFPLI